MDKALTVAQATVLESLWFDSTETASGEVWWHDVNELVIRALLDKGLIQEAPVHTECGTPEHKHPGYLTLTKSGEEAVENELFNTR